ncbi:MAG: hypothetical protein U5J83_05115, partial [Bryobacterales bacterium]|nr:hypothetical protein [Bryobacterales bacterium]
MTTAPQFDRNGNLPEMHEGVRVTLNGEPSPLLSVSRDHVDFIAPEGLASSAEGERVELKVELGGQLVASYDLFANRANPRFFARGNSPWERFAAALNQDGTVNSRRNPARAGESISLFLNSAGAPAMPVAAGKRMESAGAWSTLRPTLTGVSSGIQTMPFGSTWEIGYFGVAPGLASGTLQLNATIPASVAAEALPPGEAMKLGVAAIVLAAPPEEPGQIGRIWTDLVNVWVS